MFGQPEVARHQAVVFVDLAVTMLPVVILAAGNAYLPDEVSSSYLGFVMIISHVINYLVTNVGFDPAGFQISPRLFFSSI